MALLVPLGRKGTELQVLGEAVPKCAWTHPGSGIIERVGLGLPGALTLGVRAGGPEVSFRHRDRHTCGELLFKIQPHPPFEAESGAGETPPPRGGATSNRQKALSPEVHAGWGGKGLTGNCSL